MNARVTHFRQDPLPDSVISELVEYAHKTPTEYNLQPVHYFYVTSPEMRKSLWYACLKRHELLEAPAFMVISSEKESVKNYEARLENDLAAGALTEERFDLSCRFVELNFDVRPLGIGWLAKLLGVYFLRLFTPIPNFCRLFYREWLTKQAMLACSTLMHKAESLGLGTVVVHTFDEWRVKRYAKIPRNHAVVAVVAIGYVQHSVPHISTREISEIFHRVK